MRTTGQEIDRLSSEWLNRTPPSGIRKEKLAPESSGGSKAESIFNKLKEYAIANLRQSKYKPIVNLFN